jgi:hypothetical protein
MIEDGPTRSRIIDRTAQDVGGPAARNPSTHRDAVIVYFRCEDCPDAPLLALAFIQNKGVTMLHWLGEA